MCYTYGGLDSKNEDASSAKLTNNVRPQLSNCPAIVTVLIGVILFVIYSLIKRVA